VRTFLTRVIPVFLISIILVFSFSGCGNTKETTSGPRTVIDHLNRTVTLPANPQRVISLYPIATEIVYCLQAQDKLVAVDMYSSKLELAGKIGPSNKTLPTFTTTDSFNAEELLKMNPDLVIIQAYYPDEVTKLADAGLPVIAFDYHGKTTEQEIQLIGAALGKDKEAQKLLDYRKERQDKVASIITTMPETERKQVFYLRYDTALKTASANAFENELISEAGGINYGKDLTTGSWVEVSLEQLYVWNPGTIISAPVISGGTFVTVADLKADDKWKSLKAIKDDNVWVMPMGYFKMDCSAPENILGLMYLAKKLYPEKFNNIDLQKEIKDFFSTFYHYELSDDELSDILKQQGLQMGNSTKK